MAEERLIQGGGTAELAWQPWLDAAAEKAAGACSWLPQSARMVIVAPHPDDEVLTCGATLAMHVEHGGEILLVAVSDGEASHPGASADAARRLALCRRQESDEGLSRLGVRSGETVRLGLPDGQIGDHLPGLASALRSLLRPTDVVFATWRFDGHPDHDATGRAAACACAAAGSPLLEAPVWMRHWANPDDPRVPWDRLRALRLTPDAWARKQRALQAHASQLRPHSGDAEPVLGVQIVLRAGRTCEHFSSEGISAAMPHTPEHFESLFTGSDDLWDFRSRWYESRKRALILACLPAQRYACAYEPGRANGELSAALADRCQALLVSDGSAKAVALARARLAGLPHAEVRHAWLPSQRAEQDFDLIVVSELGYFLSIEGLDALADRMRASLRPGATVLACHWRRPIAGCVLDGDGVHARLGERLSMAHICSVMDDDLRLDVWCRDKRSVAQREGFDW